MKKVTIEQIQERGINRLCHFTKAKNLTYILEELNGILASELIPAHIKDINDENRLDNKLDYICCSVEYPNIYYLDRIKDNDKLFKEWIILSINPKIIVDTPCLFSQVNAATEYGKYIEGGRVGFSKLYSQVINTSKRTITRENTTLKACPTDIQAEVLVKKFIPKEYINAVIVQNESEGKKQHFKLKMLGLDKSIEIIVAPELFEKESYSKIRHGIKLKEYIL